MKKFKLVFSILTMLILLANTALAAEKTEEKKEEKMRGVWVASVLNLNYPSVSTTSESLLKIEADNILKSAENAGFNAVFLQVRPTADSLYKSDIFPWSKYLTGTEGLAPNNGFDPLAYFIEEAHKRDIEVHAWINPYRITKKRADEPAYTVDMLSETHPARLHPEYVISHDGNLYFDPALEGVRDLITAGVKEIIDGYDVDGIHFDDYFYPAKDFADDASYARLAGGKDLGDWRRENVNKLVEQVYKTVHESDKDVVFGISPFAIWANESSFKNGSKTSGLQSYFAHYADSLYWIDKSIIDYITPQVYWHMGFDVADFKVLTDWWNEQVKGSNVDLYIGLAAYRSDSPDEDSPWHRNYELIRQLNYIQTKDEVDGFIAFSMSSVRSSNRIYNAFRGAGKIKSSAPYATPSINLYGGLKKQYIGGLINPAYPAYLNGELINKVSDKGFYGIFMEANKEKMYKLENAGLVDYKQYKDVGDDDSNGSTDDLDLDYLNEILKKEVLFARILEDDTNLKAELNPYNGSMELLPKGVMTEIKAAHGRVLELASNRFIDGSNVEIVHKNADAYALYEPRYIVENGLDKIEFSSNIKPFIKMYLDGNNLILDLSGNVYIPELIIPESALIKSYKKEHVNYRNRYVLELKDRSKLGGYYVEYEGGKTVVNIKHKKFMKDDDKPLEGFDIMLDAGHGGKDTGALGLLGFAYPEKSFNLDLTLKLAKKLEKLGANVILTREEEKFISLHERLKMVYENKPDLFISIHANSHGLHKDINKLSGFSVYYSKDIAKEYAELTQSQICANTACKDVGVRTNEFYVIRATHCPSVLLESGFLPNPEDFDWLCDDTKQDEYASELARTVLLYFEK